MLDLSARLFKIVIVLIAWDRQLMHRCKDAILGSPSGCFRLVLDSLDFATNANIFPQTHANSWRWMCRGRWAEVNRLLIRRRYGSCRDGVHRSLDGSLIIGDIPHGVYFMTLNHLNNGCRRCSLLMSVESAAHMWKIMARLTLCSHSW